MTGWIVLIPIVYLIWIVVKSEEGKVITIENTI